jgi:hypothetical protein
MDRSMLEFLAPISPSHKTALELFDRIQSVKDNIDLSKMDLITYCENELCKLADKMNIGKLSKIEKIIDGLDHKGLNFVEIDKQLISNHYNDYKENSIAEFMADIQDENLERREILEVATERWDEEAAAHLSMVQKNVEKEVKRELTCAEESYLYKLIE